MRGRKITAKEFNHAPVKTANLKKTSTIKVFKGNVIIDDPYLKIKAGTFKWFVLVPEEFITDLDWNRIFRTGALKTAMHNGAVKNLNYKNFVLENGSLLFAFF